ncbi:MAG: hypothetical protein IJA75_05760 [Oscillospiraceae bacterium]|nr:hypothetical protein [Oscillospiraceae bacterium]
MAVTITWDGDSTGRTTFTESWSNYVWVKVSDLVFTYDEMLGGQVNSLYLSEHEMSYCKNYGYRRAINGVSKDGIISGTAGSVANGFALPESGTFVWGTKAYTISLPNATAAPAEPIVAETPTITQNLPLFGKVTYEQGGMADTLTIAAEVSDGGALTYQWYKDDVAIDGATESSYTPYVEVGSAVYYCVVTNTLGEATATVQSESITIIGYAVFLAASDPVPVGVAPKIDPVSMTLGWLIGCRIAGQRGKGGVMPEEPEVPVGEPVAYLYNSRRLPGLPGWTKDYEIVTIVDPNLGDTYIKAAKGYTIESSWNITYGTHHTTYGVDVVRSPLENWAWQEPVAQTDDWLWSNSPYLNDYSTYPFWSNTDLICKNDDGTEYVGLAGSEPVPVYE